MSDFDVNFQKVGTDRIRFQWTQSMRRAGMEVTPVTIERLRAAAPFGIMHADAGRLRKSIGVRTETMPGHVKFMFVSTAPYAKYVIEGTKGGTQIFPKKTHALRWAAGFAPGDGYSFATYVTRGATPSNDFNVRVATELEPFIRETFKRAIIVD